MSYTNSFLNVITFTNKSIIIPVDLKNTTPNDVLDFMVKENGYQTSEPLDLINFKFNSKRFQSRYKSLFDLGIKKSHETIHMIVDYMTMTYDSYPSEDLIIKSNNSRFQIFVKGLNNKHYTVGIEPDMTILDVKKLVTMKTDFPHHSFHLLRNYSNLRKLDETKTIKEYTIEKEETFRMVLRLRGGSIKESFKDEVESTQDPE